MKAVLRMVSVVISANSSWNIQNFRLGLVRALIDAGHQVTTITPDDRGVSARGVNIPHIKCKMSRSGMNPVSDLSYFINIMRLLRKVRPHAYLGFTIKPNVYGCFACRALGISAVPNVSGLGTVFLGGAAVRIAVSVMYKIAFRKAHPIFFQNCDDRELFVGEGIVRSDQSVVLPGSGVDLHQFPPSALPNDLRFLMIARLLGDKGVREYVDAARRVKRVRPEIQCSLLGEIDRNNRTAIRRDELDEWLREGILEYLGSTSDVRPFIRQATAVVLPSYREGLSRTLLEAAAMGRPLIGTDVPGCREVVREGVTGFLCKARNSESLAGAMKRLADLSPGDRQKMGTRARLMAEQEYDEALVVRAYLEAISGRPS